MNTTTIRRTRRIIIAVLLVGIAAFVVFNLYASRDIETVDQSVPTTSAPEVARPDPAQEPIVRTGTFSSLNGYSVSGDITVTESESGSVLSLSEDFAASAGPDVLVYLTKNDTAAQNGAIEDPISLGPLKSFSGSQTYTLPENADEYTSVVIYCRAFSSAFGAARIE